MSRDAVRSIRVEEAGTEIDLIRDKHESCGVERRCERIGRDRHPSAGDAFTLRAVPGREIPVCGGEPARAKENRPSFGRQLRGCAAHHGFHVVGMSAERKDVVLTCRHGSMREMQIARAR